MLLKISERGNCPVAPLVAGLDPAFNIFIIEACTYDVCLRENVLAMKHLLRVK